MEQNSRSMNEYPCPQRPILLPRGYYFEPFLIFPSRDNPAIKASTYI